MRRGLGRTAEPGDILKGVVAGAAGGLAGCAAMNGFGRLWSLALRGRAPASTGGPHDGREWQERTEGRNSNEIAADAAAVRIAGRHLAPGELAVAAPAVHFAFGAAMGALYGCLVETSGKGGLLNGAAFGASVWAAADEVAMPALGLSGTPAERPIEPHVQSLASHLVFGAAAETVRRAVRTALG